jgi:hypothetical protein
LRDFLLADSKAYKLKCPLFVPRLLSGRCHDDAHTAHRGKVNIDSGRCSGDCDQIGAFTFWKSR